MVPYSTLYFCCMLLLFIALINYLYFFLADGDVLFYDLSSFSQNIILKINADENGSCLNFEFNKKQSDLLAIAYSKNKVRIMQLCDRLTCPKKDEASYLNSLLE